MMDINMDLRQCSISFLIKNILVVVLKMKIFLNKELADELHEPIIRKFNKIKVHSFFIDCIWGADLADMQLISEYGKGFKSSLCVIDIYSK